MLVMTAATLHIWPSGSCGAASTYEEGLKQFTQEVIAEAVKAKKHRLAFLDFTDLKGNPTPLGQFLAEETGTHVLVTGDLDVVDGTLVRSTLKKLHVDRIDRTHAKAVRRAAKAVRANVFISGSYSVTAEVVQVTAKLISPLNAQVVGTARGEFPKAGPLAALIPATDTPPTVALDGPQEPPGPAGLGVHRNEYYEMAVQSLETEDGRIKVRLTIENRSPRELTVSCLLQETMLKDDHGATWVQGVEENREGVCRRGLDLAPRQKEHTVLTFTAPPDATASQFTLQYYETSPRRDAVFTIEGLKTAPGGAAPVNP
jgi:hypothetical protein